MRLDLGFTCSGFWIAFIGWKLVCGFCGVGYSWLRANLEFRVGSRFRVGSGQSCWCIEAWSWIHSRHLQARLVGGGFTAKLRVGIATTRVPCKSCFGHTTLVWVLMCDRALTAAKVVTLLAIEPGMAW